jgi:hypothetical protein
MEKEEILNKMLRNKVNNTNRPINSKDIKEAKKLINSDLRFKDFL